MFYSDVNCIRQKVCKAWFSHIFRNTKYRWKCVLAFGIGSEILKPSTLQYFLRHPVYRIQYTSVMQKDEKTALHIINLVELTCILRGCRIPFDTTFLWVRMRMLVGVWGLVLVYFNWQDIRFVWYLLWRERTDRICHRFIGYWIMGTQIE